MLSESFVADNGFMHSPNLKKYFYFDFIYIYILYISQLISLKK